MTNNNTNQNKKTINEKELETLQYWKDNKIFEKSIEMPAGENKVGDYAFYDGPPFATGMPHHGTLMAGTVKDVIPRYWTMKGYSVRRKWGWDCHGLPIENMIEKEIGLNSKKEIEEYGIDRFNKAAMESVLRYDKEWKEIIPRMGRWVDMENDYKTMDWTYTESVWWVWKTLYDKKLAFEGYKMMHICPRCETTLAQSEVALEYNDITDISLTAMFELQEEKNTYILAWTTTPWTLPGNTALAVNKNIDYIKVKAINNNNETKYFILAKSKFEEYKKYSEKDYTIFEIEKEMKGQELIGKSYSPVFDYFNNEKYLSGLENSKNIWKVWHADFITEDAGTGIAHQAPAFGADDMELARINNIAVIKHILMNGQFVKDITDFQGLVVKKKDDSQSTDIEIVKALAHNGKLFEKHKIIHSYPLCWRCKTPLLNYATSSWFVNVPAMRDKLLSENSRIGWVPDHIKDGRFGKWLEGARDWAVSRQRYWGAPLPIWKSLDGEEIKVIGSLEEIAQTPKNKYFAMRHGESLSNINGILDINGDVNNHLTDNGRESIMKVKENNKINFDIIISSPFLRTKETAEIIADGKEIIYDERLRESNLGIWDKRSVIDYHKAIENYNLKKKVEGGESHQDMINRTMSLLAELENKYQNKNILLISHAGPISMMIAGAELITEEKLRNQNKITNSSHINNGEIITINYKIVPRDENGMINLHKPYIDRFMLKDSRGMEMRIIGDVFDCWFESGSMPYGQLHYPFENKDVFESNFPADFIAESLDQTRGWFYSLINLGVGLLDKAPYRNVICNGIINGKDGKKISKSLKNYTDPMLLVGKYGADAFRLSLMNSPVVRGESVIFTDDLIDETYKKNIQRLENCSEFYQMYKRDDIEANNNSKNILDIWILSRLSQLIQKSINGYESYQLDDAMSELPNFIDDLSTWYLRRSRDRLKDGNEESIATFRFVLLELSKCIAPIMPFLAERLYLSVTKDRESVHLEKYPTSNNINLEVIDGMKETRIICSDGLMLRQKNNINVRQPLQSITINKRIDQQYIEIIKDELNVKSVLIDESIDNLLLDMNITEELLKEGEERELIRKINDKRKEMGLTRFDIAKIIFNNEKDFNVCNDNILNITKLKSKELNQNNSEIEIIRL